MDRRGGSDALPPANLNEALRPALERPTGHGQQFPTLAAREPLEGNAWPRTLRSGPKAEGFAGGHPKATGLTTRGARHRHRITIRSTITVSTPARTRSNASGDKSGGTMVSGSNVTVTRENGLGMAKPSQDFNRQ
jgi:hypothetical protein